MRRVSVLLLLSAVAWGMALTSGGCRLFYRDPRAAALNSDRRAEQGLTLVLPGIEGTSHLNEGIRKGLDDGGVPTAIAIHDWTLGPALALISQMWEGRARDKAGELASRIRAYRILHPGRPVVLVGHSGGCAVAVFALEQLPASESIDALIMLGPSISPDYNLSRALARVEGVAYCYHSEKDVGFLGLATWIFGTVDRRHTASAGKDGFKTPPASRDLYARKLRQIPWDPEMEMAGNSGGHTDWANPIFVREYIASRVIAELADHAQRASARRAAAETQPSDVLIVYRPPTTQYD